MPPGSPAPWSPENDYLTLMIFNAKFWKEILLRGEFGVLHPQRPYKKLVINKKENNYF